MEGFDTRDFQRPGVLHEFGVFIGRLTRIADGVVLALTFSLLFDSRRWLEVDERLAQGVLAVAIAQALAGAFRFSRSWRIIRIRHELAEMAGFSLFSFGAIGLMFSAMGSLPLDRSMVWGPAFATWYVATLVGAMALRVVIRMSLRYLRAYGLDQRTAAFVGATPTAARLAQTFTPPPVDGHPRNRLLR